MPLQIDVYSQMIHCEWIIQWITPDVHKSYSQIIISVLITIYMHKKNVEYDNAKQYSDR